MNVRELIKGIKKFNKIQPRRCVGVVLAMSMVCALAPSKLMTTTAEAAETAITGTYTIKTAGEYKISGLSLTNGQIIVNANITATLNVYGTNTINNSGSYSYYKSPILINSGAKLTINLTSGSSLTLYGSPGKTGDLTTSANLGGYAGINVPSGAGLTVKGSGTLKAYGGDAGDTLRNNTHTGGNRSPQGGGGGGAGIGGNGGSGCKSLDTQNNGQAGGAGQTAGTIVIVDTVTVIAAGGAGGTGGYARANVSTAGDGASSGGGYPGAGIGGGGGGGGAGGTQSNGSGGAGGGGFSGGASEGSQSNTFGYNGLGTQPYVNPGNSYWQAQLPGGGGYFSPGSYAKQTGGYRGPVGGGGGGAASNSYVGGNGGAGGAGGTVAISQSAKVTAYNGNYITVDSSKNNVTSLTSGYEYGKYPTPIYGQLGYPSNNVSNKNSLMVINGRTDAAVAAELEANKVVKALTVTGKAGVGTGAGYSESSNGVYYETPNAPTNVEVTYVSTPNTVTDGEFTSDTMNKKITVKVDWDRPTITNARPIGGYNVYVDGVLKKTVSGANTLTATVDGVRWLDGSKIEVKSWYTPSGIGMTWESSTSCVNNYVYKAPPAIRGVRESDYSFRVYWSGVNEVTPVNTSQRIVAYSIYYKVGDYDGPELTPTESDYDKMVTVSGTDIKGSYLFEGVDTEKLYYIRMKTHYRDGSVSPLSEYTNVTDVYIQPKAPSFSLTRPAKTDTDANGDQVAPNTSAKLTWRGARGTGMDDYAIYYRLNQAPDVSGGKYDGVVKVPVTVADPEQMSQNFIVTGIQEEQTYFFVIETRTKKYGTHVSEAKSIFTYVEPEEIKDFTAKRISDGKAEIAWYGARGSGINSYTIYYTDDESNPYKYQKTYETRDKSGTVTVDGLDTDGFWYFRIISNTDELGSSPMSGYKRIYAYNDPVAPTVVTGKWVSSTSAEITWSGAGGTDIIGYRIYYDYGSPKFDPDRAYLFPVDDTVTEEDPNATPGPNITPDPSVTPDPDATPEPVKLPPIIEVNNKETSGTVIIENLPNLDSSPRRTFYFKVETVTNPYVVDKNDEAERERRYSSVSEQYASVLLYDRPSQPQLGRVYAGFGRGIISTSLIEDDGDNSILTYHVYAQSDDTNEISVSDYDVDGDTYLENYLLAEELTNGTGYTITVTAENEAGESEPSEPQWIKAGVPMCPENFRIETGEERQIIAEYDKAKYHPVDIQTIGEENLPEILGYHIFLNGNENFDNPDGTVLGVDTLRYVTYGKYSGDKVRVKITAFNKFGDSPLTEEFSRIAGAPTTTYIDKVVYYGEQDSADKFYGGLKTGVDLSWPASKDNGYRVQYYTIYVEDTVTGEVKEYKAKELDEITELVKCEINIPCTDLVRGRTYSVTIEPVNLAGLGEISVPREFVFGVPQPPVITRLDVAPAELTAYYQHSNDNGKPITEYRIYRNGEHKETITENLYSETITKHLMDMLINGYEYRVQVSAVNADGESELSEIVTGTPGDRPLAPRDSEAYAVSDTEINVKWKNPSNNGGLKIEYYNIMAYHVVDNDGVITYEPVKMKDSETPSSEDYIKTVTGSSQESEQNAEIEYECVIPNLIKGEKYKFEICAENRAGNGPIASIDNIPTMVEPGAPVITSVFSDAGSSEVLPINIHWEASEGSDLYGFDGYEIYIVNESAATEAEKYTKVNKDFFTGTEQTFTSSKLLRGNTYKLAMRAHNTVGYSEYSNIVELNMGIPQAPINVQVVPYKDSMTVTWEMENLENTIVTGYRIYLDNTSVAAEVVTGSTNMTATLTGLIPQKTYTVYVRAINNIGSGLLSAPVKVTLGSPSAPLNAVATAGYEQVDVSWEAPERDNGYPITEYRIYVNGIYDDTIADRTITVPDTTTTLADLVGGNEYTLTVVAVNDAGESVHSNVMKATPWTRPARPELKTNSTVARDTSFEFTFIAPQTNLVVKEYGVYLDGVRVNTVFSPTEPYMAIKKGSVANEYIATVYNVSPGKAAGKDYGHTFYLETVVENPSDPTLSLISEAPQSDQEIYKVTTGIPAAPVIDIAEPGNSNVHLKFHVPNEDSVGVDYYEVVYNATTHKYYTNDITITGLTNKTPYDFSIRAVNTAGAGPYSAAIYVTPGTAPAPNLTGQPGDGSVSLSWTLENISSDIPLPGKYKIYQDGEFVMESDTTIVSVPGLTNGREYKFAVSAVNRNGEGMLSNEVAVTPRNGAGPVINVVATALSETEIKLTWDTPEYDGGSPIIGYRVSGKGKIVTGSVDERCSVISNLERDTMYRFTIYARTAYGLGTAYVTPYLRTKTLPGAPSIYGMSSADKTITAKWNEPIDTGEDTILGYNVYMYNKDDNTYTKINTDLVTDLSYVISSSSTIKLEPKLEYGVAISAVNSIGEGPKSAIGYTDVVDTVALTAPTAPRNLVAVPTNGTIDLSWVKPVTDGNSDIDRYVIYLGRSADDMEIKTNVAGDVYRATISGLINNVTYYAGVVAVNGVTEDNNGYSVMSNVVSAIPYKYAVPTIPTNLKYEINYNGTTMKVDWDPVTAEGALYYNVYVNGKLYQKITDGTTTIDIPVEDGIKYGVQIISGNESGEAASSYIYAYNNLNIRDEGGNLNLTDANYDGIIDEVPVFRKPDPVGDFSKTREDGSHTVKLRWKGAEISPTSAYDVDTYYMYVNTSTEKIKSFSVDPDTGEPITSGLTYNDGYYETEIDIDFGVIYTFHVSAANEYGESSKSASLLEYVKVQQYPTALKAEQENPDNLKNIVLSWQKPAGANPIEYLLYINGYEYRVTPQFRAAPQPTATPEPLATEEPSDPGIQTESAGGFSTKSFSLFETVPEYVCYVDETGLCTMEYEGSDNKDYIFRVSAVYDNDIESTRTNAAYASTLEPVPQPPTDLTATVTSELTALSESADISLTWTPPSSADGEIDHYVLYVNGEAEPGIISKDETSLTYHGAVNMFYEFRMVSVSGEQTSQKSDAAIARTILPKETVWEGAPDAPTDVTAELNDEQTSVTITWNAPEHDSLETKKDPDGYDIYINGKKVNTDPIVPDSEGNLTYTYSPLAPDTIYEIEVESIVIETGDPTTDPETGDEIPGETTVISGERSEPIQVKTDPNELPVLPAPLNLDGTLDDETLEIALTWDEVEDATSYNLYVYSTTSDLQIIEDISDTEYNLIGQANTDYVFRVAAVYAVGDQSREGNKSNRWATSTVIPESEDIPTPAGAPRITKSRSDGKSKVAIYWVPPTQDADDIIGYYVFRNGNYEIDENQKPIIVSADSINASGEYQYIFEDVPEGVRIPTKVIALKKYNNQYIMGTDSNTWYIKLELNIVTKWPPEDDEEPKIPKDDDGDGYADDIGATVKLIGTLDAGRYKEGKITIYDEYDAVVKEQDISGNFEVLVSDIAERKNYKLKITKKGYLSYTITDFPMDHTMNTINLWTISLIAGNANEDDIIDIDDLSIVNKNYDVSGEDVMGDISGDGTVGIDDLGYINANYDKRSVKLTWTEHNASIKQ